MTEKKRTPPFTETKFYEKLCTFGSKCGLEVFVFSPGHIRWATRSVIGYTFNTVHQKWFKAQYPLPDLVYDRCFSPNHKAYKAYRAEIKQLRLHRKISFLGHGLKGKWHVFELLSNDPDLIPYLPQTEKLGDISTVKRWLNNYGELILKPRGGSQGRNVLYIREPTETNQHYLVHGRDVDNRLFKSSFVECHSLYAWLKPIIAARPYIIQQYLQLTTEKSEPFDIRAFIQKNRQGAWQFIGCAARIGKPGSLTSNLHGGGCAQAIEPFLDQHYGPNSKSILEEIKSISMRIATSLEQYHGRLVELGIDIGIDQSGHLWIIEVNSRPGRSIFQHIGDQPARSSTVRNPIYYACYLWDRQLGG